MKINLHTIEKLVGFELPGVDELVPIINTKLGGVEDSYNLGEKYKDAKIVKVIESEKHPNADKLSVCKIDAGSGELIQVVCGAPNVHEDMWAVWLPPESIVPATFDDAEPFKLGARELRGVMSHGMLAAGDELGINNDHEGIIEITDYDLSESIKLDTGMSFAEAFGLNTWVLDIENKMFTHRPDLFGQLGVAREISAILHPFAAGSKSLQNHFNNPDWYRLHPQFTEVKELKLEVFNDIEELVPRFMAVAMKGIEVKPSPLWLQCLLVSLGSKPINNIVDLTNYLMLMTAQPSHAYDYNKLAEHKIGVRMAEDGEKAKLLNGKIYELTSNDIVIVDGEGVIGLGGVMGGLDSEVTTETKNIVLEVATFDMYAVRKTSMCHGLFTDAVTRFNKGQSPLQNDRVVARLIELMSGEQASEVYDLPDKKGQLIQESIHGEIVVSAEFINQRLGTDFTLDEIGNIMRPANIFSYPSETDAGGLVVTAPFWRTDIEQGEDIVEEVGRLYGFSELPRELPRRSISPVSKNHVFEKKKHIREQLSRAGANEVLTYSFVHERTLKSAGQEKGQAYMLSNALSPDLQYYRVSLTPSLLEKVHPNIKTGHDEFALFEIGKAHLAGDIDSVGLPNEHNRITFVWTAKKSQKTGYYVAKRYLDLLVAGATYLPLTEVDFKENYNMKQMALPFEKKRSAGVFVKDKLIGVVGEYKTNVRTAFKLPTSVAGFEVALEGVLANKAMSYRPLSRYPRVTQDISLNVPVEVAYKSIFELASRVVAESELGDCEFSLRPLSIYQADDDTSSKTVTLRLTIASYNNTLTDGDVSLIMDGIESVAERELGAHRA